MGNTICQHIDSDELITRAVEDAFRAMKRDLLDCIRAEMSLTLSKGPRESSVDVCCTQGRTNTSSPDTPKPITLPPSESKLVSTERHVSAFASPSLAVRRVMSYALEDGE